MEVTAAAAQAVTYTSNKSLAEQINDYLATTKTSIATPLPLGQVRGGHRSH